jgi:fatty-acyl-CoA synthase
LEEGVQMTAEDVQLFCRGKIARYKIPKYVFFIDQFPLTGSGKIQKFKLKEMSLELCEKMGIVVE